MKRWLFEDLVVSRPEAGPRGGLAVPLSVGIHALTAAAFLSIPVLTSQAFPKPVAPPLPLPPVTVGVRLEGGDPRPRPPAIRQERRQKRSPSLDVDPPTLSQAPRLTDEPRVEGTGSSNLCTVDCGGTDAGGGSPGGGSSGIGDGVGVGPGPGSGPLRPGGDFRAPTKLHHVNPIYPDLAKRAGVHGVVIIECVIDVAGRVVDARVLRGHPLLDAAAVVAVQQWLYTPTRLNNVPVAVVMTVTVRFELH